MKVSSRAAILQPGVAQKPNGGLAHFQTGAPNYIHLIAGAYYLFSSPLGEYESRLFLCSPPYILNDFIDHMACYQYIVGYPNIVDVAHRIYWDDVNNAPKRGAQSINNPGNIRRFSKVINQLELTYDVYSMEPDKILQLLPSEFNRWKKAHVL